MSTTDFFNKLDNGQLEKLANDDLDELKRQIEREIERRANGPTGVVYVVTDWGNHRVFTDFRCAAICFAETALGNMRVYERELLRKVVRGGHQSMSCGELPITDLNTEMEKVLPAHFELAINKLETLSTKLEAPAVSS
ncbi:DUF5448 family protein [Klebsiella pneumoniae]|uniref:DUF5448 family protein n=1 Tax=Klebsiella pneumoniae TaxID=573 RepID=UPI0006587472|nr:DUF5448 family protein [Klebsiella pneumoniae]KMI89725.1 hypothetical protein SN01_05418 [Klebsiella pneumoniae]